MSASISRFDLQDTNQPQTRSLPALTTIVHFGPEGGLPYIWAHVIASRLTASDWTFIIVDTPSPVPDGYTHQGTAVFPTGARHLYSAPAGKQ